MLRQGMLRLAKPVGEAADLMEDMGINAFDADGNMKSLDKVVGELEKGLKGQSKQQKAAALATIFGSESTAGWTVLLDQGSDTLKDYTKDLENSEGAAKDMADTMQDNAEGAIVRMQSALSGMKIELGEKLLPTLGKGADMIGDFANHISEMDEETINLIAQLALLTTGVLGVTTVVAGLVTGLGAFMAFAGPIGVAITAGTLLLGGLAAAVKLNTDRTKTLAEEQRQSEVDARRYGQGLSEGTLEGVKGYNDLYEGAKIKMLELKNMSGKEAQATSAEVVKAFSEMTENVVAELEAQKDQIGKAIEEVLGVAGEAGIEKAGELTNRILEEYDSDIAQYVGAMEVVQEAHDKYNNKISEMPDEFKKQYLEALNVIEGGSREFAQTQEEMMAIQKNISDRQGNIMFEDAQKYYEQVNDVYKKSVDSANQFYNEKREIFDRELAQGRISEEEYGLLMAGVEAKTSQMLYDASRSQEEALQMLSENMDARGALLDLATGEEFKRLQERDGYNQLQTESDSKYLQRWLDHTQETLASQNDFSKSALDVQKKNLEAMLVEMGHTKKDAKKIAKDLVDGMVDELEKGEPESKKAGKKKGDKHKEGLDSTKDNNKKSAENIKDQTLKEFLKGEAESQKGGKGKGDSHSKGIDSTKGANQTSARGLSTSVTELLAKTSDGGGGRKAGSDFTTGLRNRQGSARSAGSGVATSGRGGLSSVSTYGTGQNFTSGFSRGIGSISVWNAAWSIGKSALSALNSAIRTASPSKETEQSGGWFTEGFSNAIDDGTKEAIKKSKEMGQQSLAALSGEIDGHKHSFAKISTGIEQGKQSLKVEHELNVNNHKLETRITKLDNTLNKLINHITNVNTDKESQSIVMNISVRNNDDINKIDEKLNELSGRRRKAFGG